MALGADFAEVLDFLVGAAAFGVTDAVDFAALEVAADTFDYSRLTDFPLFYLMSFLAGLVSLFFPLVTSSIFLFLPLIAGFSGDTESFLTPLVTDLTFSASFFVVVVDLPRFGGIFC